MTIMEIQSADQHPARFGGSVRDEIPAEYPDSPEVAAVLPGARGVTPSWGVRLGIGGFFAVFALLFIAKLYFFALNYRTALQEGTEPTRQVALPQGQTP